MSQYLARLKEIEIGKIFDNPPVTEVLKVAEVSFNTFDTSIQAENLKNILLIQSWLSNIGEPQEDHYLVLDKCRNNPEAMEYFLKHARGGYEAGKP